MVYARRESAFAAADTQWRVEPAGLVQRLPDGWEWTLPWREVRTVRLAHMPTRFKPRRHVFQVQAGKAGSFTLDNMHYRGPADFEDRSGPFSEFVRAAMARIRAEAPGATLRFGAAAWSYWLQVAFVAGAFAALVLVITGLDIPFGAWPGSAILKMAVVIALAPLLVYWLLAAWPRGVPLDTDIEGVLPRPEAP